MSRIALILHSVLQVLRSKNFCLYFPQTILIENFANETTLNNFPLYVSYYEFYLAFDVKGRYFFVMYFQYVIGGKTVFTDVINDSFEKH